MYLTTGMGWLDECHKQLQVGWGGFNGGRALAAAVVVIVCLGQTLLEAFSVAVILIVL
jgi:ammonia channel protein AmtB